MKVLPKSACPELKLETVSRGTWRLADRKPQHFTMVVFYRGHHCPLCKKQLQELDAMVDEFAEAGIDLVAISMKSQELAERAVKEWEIEKLTVAYGLSLEEAQRWGLFISAAVKGNEPDRFSEPGLFFVRPGGELYAASIQTMPFARPPARKLLSFLSWVAENDYPARGEAG